MKNAEWRLCQVSTTEQVFERINQEAAQPVGAILFGVDSDFKDRVYRRFTDEVAKPCLWGSYGYPNALKDWSEDTIYYHDLSTPDNKESRILLILAGNASADHAKRHLAVKTLRDSGMKTVIGVYVRSERPKFWEYLSDCKMSAQRANQFKKLTQNPPTAEGLDYLLEVNERAEASHKGELGKVMQQALVAVATCAIACVVGWLVLMDMGWSMLERVYRVVHKSIDESKR